MEINLLITLMYIHQNKINIHLMEIGIQTSYIVQATTTSFMNDKITIDLMQKKM
jgi:hypothetical protein